MREVPSSSSAATLYSVRSLPLNGLGLLFGVDRLMATCTALTNVVGNCVATFVIAKWENAFDPAKFDAYLNEQAAGHIDPSGSETPITHIGHSGAEYPVGHTAPTSAEQPVPAAALRPKPKMDTVPSSIPKTIVPADRLSEPISRWRRGASAIALSPFVIMGGTYAGSKDTAHESWVYRVWHHGVAPGYVFAPARIRDWPKCSASPSPVG